MGTSHCGFSAPLSPVLLKKLLAVCSNVIHKPLLQDSFFEHLILKLKIQSFVQGQKLFIIYISDICQVCDIFKSVFIANHTNIFFFSGANLKEPL